MCRVDLGHGLTPWVVVSNNGRNRNLETSLAARITTTDKHTHVPTVVPLGSVDPLVGFVLVDDIIQLYRDELDTPLGTLTSTTMRQVGAALRTARRASLSPPFRRPRPKSPAHPRW